MRLLPIVMLLFSNAVAVAASNGEQRVDKSKDFAYVLPDGWKVVQAPKGKHDSLVLPTDDGKNRNIVINDQPGKSSLAELKQKYERDLPKALKDFQLISSDLVELNGKREAIRIVHTNTTPGVPVRQVNYVLEIAGKRYFIACTALKEDDGKYDEVFAAFVSSMVEPER